MEEKRKEKRDAGKSVKREAKDDTDHNGFEHEEDYYNDKNKKKSLVIGGSFVNFNKRSNVGTTPTSKCCQADHCTTDLSEAKQYYKRHKVCEYHSKSQAVLLAGIRQRFCQQCSRFHEVSEFDGSKRSCRSRLAGHNERRRKNIVEGSSRDESAGAYCLKDFVFGEADEEMKITIQKTENYKTCEFR